MSLCLFWVSAAWAIEEPIRKIEELALPVPELAVRVSTARVLIADYDLIRKDFPETKKLKVSQIDAWLLNSAAYVAMSQTQQSVVNTQIELGSPIIVTEAYRPAHYGRALVFQVGSGLIDAKGVGAVQPGQFSHGNGLLTLGEALREFIYEKMVDRIFQHYRKYFDLAARYKTVGSYAVIDFGFDVIHSDGSVSPAGAIFRQAHDRYGDPKDKNYNFLPALTSLKIEKILRLYGVTSAGVGRQKEVEIADLQGTKNEDVVDFGSFLVFPVFTADVSFFLDDELELRRGTVEFVQPAEALRLPFKTWGYFYNQIHPKYDGPRIFSDQVAWYFREKKYTRKQVHETIFSDFFAPVFEKWMQYELDVKSNSDTRIVRYAGKRMISYVSQVESDSQIVLYERSQWQLMRAESSRKASRSLWSRGALEQRLLR